MLIKTGHRYNINIWILIMVYLHENVGRVGADLHLQSLRIPSSFMLFCCRDCVATLQCFERC